MSVPIIVGVLIGAVLGPALFGGGFGSVLGGVALGALAGWLFTLDRRLREIERAAERSGRPLTRVDEPVNEPGRTPETEPAYGWAPEAGMAEAPGAEPGAAGDTGPDAEFGPEPEPSMPPGPEPATVQARATEPADPAALEPSIAEQLFERVKGWFTTGNVPVKVGIILSLIGVGFLVRVAVDRNWIALPIELRLVGVALFGLALLGIGWRLRDSRPGYARSLQGGGVAIVYLTIYAAFAFYDLLPTILAFALLVVVTAAAGTLAVLNNSRELAVLGIVGGFMAPVLASSGAGDHVILFSYYALLNAAVVAIAWFRAWRELNVLSFLFTFGVASVWGQAAYTPAEFATTEPFLILFTAMYIAIPVLFASRTAPKLRGFVDGTLVFGTPLIGFGLQTQLVGDIEYGLAISAATLAAVYGALGTWLYRRGIAELRVLAEAFLSLGVVFVAITLPLALDAAWTSAAWSVQGAAMIWLGFRQGRRLALLGGLVLQLAAGVTYFARPDAGADALVVLNGRYLGALLIALAGWISSRFFDRIHAADDKRRTQVATWGLLVWGAAWWFGAGLAEIGRFVPERFETNAALALVAGTSWAAMLAAARLGWQRVATLGCLLVPAMALALVFAIVEQGHALGELGWLAWPLALATHFAFLRRHEIPLGSVSNAQHVGGYTMIAALLATEAHWWVARSTTGVWAIAAAIAVVAVLHFATLRTRDVLEWPLRAHWRNYVLRGVGGTLVGIGTVALAMILVSPGDPDPLPYVPLLNPLEFASGLVFVAGWYWYEAVRDQLGVDGLAPRYRVLVPALLGLFFVTMTAARTVHHWADVPFALEPLAESTVLQASLSIVWGSTALAGMVAGARAANRTVWIAGAVLMGVVVLKLFVVELGNTGTVARVVSFLGVGVLLLIVGYFAPVPPRSGSQATAS